VGGEEVEHGEEQNDREVGKRTLEKVTADTGKNQGDDEKDLGKELTILIVVEGAVRNEANKRERKDEETDVNKVQLETLLTETFGHKAVHDATL
jgi:hypothetical protein